MDVPELPYGSLFAKDVIINIVDDILLSRYLPNQPGFSYNQHVRNGRITIKNAAVLPPLETPNESRINEKEIRITYLHS